MGLFGSLIGGIFGGNKVKKASRRAEAARLEAVNKGIAETARQFDATRADLASERALGESGVAAYRGLVGLDGADAQSAAIAQLRNSPLYQSLMTNGRDAILANASATGGLRGGNTQDFLARQATDTLSQVIQNQLGNYAGTIGVGLNADTMTGQFGANAVAQQNDLRLTGANARAAGLFQRAGVNAGNWNNFGSFLDRGISSALGGGGFNIGNFLKGLF
jgi:hypothetical protein